MHDAGPTDDRDQRALELLLTQHQVLKLEQHVLAAQLQQPDTRVLTFGAGNDAQQTVIGSTQAPWRGVAILNPTAMTIYAGAGPQGALQPGLIVPPFSWICAPVNYADYGLGVSASDASGPTGSVTLIRLRQPPAGVRAGTLGGGAIATTQSAAGQVGPGITQGQVICATNVLPQGVYRVAVQIATDAGYLIRYQLQHGNTVLGPLGGAQQRETTTFERVPVFAGEQLQVVASAAFATNYHYAQIAATQLA